jgi:hypothetical protein
MTNSKSNKNQRRSRTNKSGQYQNTIYKDLAIARTPNRVVKVVLSIQGTISSSAGGIMSGAFAMDPSGSSEWASFAGIYDQFRVLGGVLNLCPITANGNSSFQNAICRFAFDNDSSATPTTYGQIMDFAEVTDTLGTWTSGVIKRIPFRRPFRNGVPQSQFNWYDEASPSASPGGLKYYGSGFSNSITYWSYILDYVVEFQMRS